MPYRQDSPARQLGQRFMAIGIAVAFLCCLAWLLALLVRLPLEDAAAALRRYTAAQRDIQRVQQAIAALREAPPADTGSAHVRNEERLRAIADVARRVSDQPCGMRMGDAPQPRVGDRIRIPPPAAAPLDALAQRVQALERANFECLQSELDAWIAQAGRGREAALVVLSVLAVLGVGWVLLRRRDQVVLRDQLHLNAQIVEAIPLPVSLRSPEGVFLLVNRAFEDSVGIARSKLVGRPVAEAVPPDFAARLLGMDRKAAAAQGPVSGDFEIADPEGARHVQVQVQAMRSLEGRLIGTVGVPSDVTALVRKEAELRETNAKLTQLSMKMLEAQEDERRRIARDLHDQVGQILTALKLQLASLARRDGIAEPHKAFAPSLDLVEEVLRHTRDLSASLHPHLLDDLGLEPALHWLIERFIRPALPQVELRCRLEPARGRPEIELVAFRIVQEALTNVVRHAGATRAGVMLETRDGELHLEVLDDGVGFEAGRTWFELQRTASVGVSSMRDRAAEVGGDLAVESARGGGTSVRARLPW